KIASTLGRVPLAAGENHFTRFEYTRLVEGGAVRFAQPDLSKTGGITEACRIAGTLFSMGNNPQSAHVSHWHQHGRVDTYAGRGRQCRLF
ncbi:MAG: enolase C-terminal domain-like protein, partial [Alphaproteobacteria bacterium]